MTGIPYYERLIDRLEQEPEIAAATPVVDSWGLLKMPYPEGRNKETETVQVWGVEPSSFASVTGYGDTLYWRPEGPDELRGMRPDDPRVELNEPAGDGQPTTAEMLYDDGLTLTNSRSQAPGIVLGLHVSVGNERQKDGSIRPLGGGYWWMPRHEVTLTLLPLDTEGGMLDPESRIFQVVNEFASGVFLIDDKRVIVPLDVAQRMLALDAGEILADRTDPATGQPEVVGVDPPKATMVLVRAADGYAPDDILQPVSEIYETFREEVAADPTAFVLPPPRAMGLTIRTWEQQQAQFIGPIEKERELMRTLFSLVYLVCAGLVLAIFWAIVFEKTRDIGILRSIGASRLGISWIFLRYGLVIGIAGSIVGAGLGWLIVRHINDIHTALGEPPAFIPVTTGILALGAIALTVLKARTGRLLPLVLGTLVTIVLASVTALVAWVRHAGGVVIWDPEVYYFTVIPNELDVQTTIITMIGAVIFSLIGAFLPAAKAADTDPVKALRYE